MALLNPLNYSACKLALNLETFFIFDSWQFIPPPNTLKHAHAHTNDILITSHVTFHRYTVDTHLKRFLERLLELFDDYYMLDMFSVVHEVKSGALMCITHIY